MIIVALETAPIDDESRYSNEPSENWEPLASAQAGSESEAKALMLENLLEMLNDGEETLPELSWLRLAYFDENGLIRRENY